MTFSARDIIREIAVFDMKIVKQGIALHWRHKGNVLHKSVFSNDR